MGACCSPEKRNHPPQATAPTVPAKPEPQLEIQQPEAPKPATSTPKKPEPASGPRNTTEWYFLSNGDRYRGEWTEPNTIHGFGIYCYEVTGFRYEGEFDKHERHGYGIFTYENPNHRYEGHWDKGCRHGRGSYRMTDFSHYVGEFRDDLMHGRGVWQSPPPSSEYYHGEWVQGTKHGHGINVDTQDGVFAGHFVKGDRSGCAYYQADGVTRIGRWNEDFLHGPGIEWSPDVYIFIGSFDAGKRDGPGTLFFANQDTQSWSRFVGTWSDTRVDGPGVLFFGDGSAVYASEWEESTGGTRTLPRSGQTTITAADVSAAADVVKAAGGFQGLQGGTYGAPDGLSTGFVHAPKWTPPSASDAVRTCLDDPSIQLALALSGALETPSPNFGEKCSNLSPTQQQLVSIPYAFAFLSPPPMPQTPGALVDAERQLRANERGLQVSPEELQRPAHVASKLMAC